MPLCRHSVGAYQETSSHATRQGTLGHSRLSSLSHCGLILTYIMTTLKKKRRRGMNRRAFPKNPRSEEKATTTTTIISHR